MPLNTNPITRLLPLLLNLSCDTCGKVQGVPLARVKPQRGVALIYIRCTNTNKRLTQAKASLLVM